MYIDSKGFKWKSKQQYYKFLSADMRKRKNVRVRLFRLSKKM